MPRIAAALGVFATLTFCVGFNVVQYPAVWKMVAASTASSPPAKAAEPLAPAHPPALAKPVPIAVPQRDTKTVADAIAKPAPAVPAMAASMPRAASTPRAAPVCEGGVCRLPSSPTAEQSPKSVAGGIDRAAPIGWPNDPPPTTPKASVVKQNKPSPSHAERAASSAPAKAAPPAAKPQARVASTGDSGLVPVVRPAKVAAQTAPATIRPAGDTKTFADGNRERKIVRRLPPIDNSIPPTLSEDAAVASDSHIPIYPSTAVR